MHKHLLCPERLREVPEQFSWLDHRLVSDHHIDTCSHQAAALYLFLVIVGDSKGLSYYSDASLMRRLGMTEPLLDGARRELISTGLICFKKPLYADSQSIGYVREWGLVSGFTLLEKRPGTIFSHSMAAKNLCG